MILLELCASLLAFRAVKSPGASVKYLPAPGHFFPHGCVWDTKAPVSDDGSVGPICIPLSFSCPVVGHTARTKYVYLL